MQTHASGFNWLQTVLSACGGAVVLAVVLGCLHWRERKRRARRERPPQKENLLRPPGFSAMRHMDDITDKLMPMLALALASGATLGLLAPALWVLLSVQSATRPTASLVVTGLIAAIAMATLLWSALRVLKLAEELRNWRFGLRGEQATAEKLAGRNLAAAGYIVFHDMPGDGDWNIDHVVVGPGGVFVLETKARPKRKANRQQEDHIVTFDGHRLQYPWCHDDEAAAQVERNAQWVRKFLAKFPPKDIPIQPVLVLPGWYVEALGNYPVKAMNAAYLVGYLSSAKPIFSVEQLEPVIQRLDERCRTVEF